MKSFFPRNNLDQISKIALAGLFIAIAVILQKVLAINYIPIIPFVRISPGGPAIIIFSSILLGPWYGLLVGAASDIIGYALFDASGFGFFPTITLIYAVLGLLPYFVFSLFKKVRSNKISLSFIIAFMIISLTIVSVVLFANDTLTLFSNAYSITLLMRILIPSIMILLFVCLLVFIIWYNRKVRASNEDLPLYPAQTSFALIIVELVVMVIFGSLMKAIAFGFETFWVILFSQLIIMFVNIPLNTIVITILVKVMSKHFLKKSED